uniref:Uncharacterized protein n=1 Tax=Arundo donax TaxID=35708 RepID=A0A0A9D9P2_ARUDO
MIMIAFLEITYDVYVSFDTGSSLYCASCCDQMVLHLGCLWILLNGRFLRRWQIV